MTRRTIPLHQCDRCGAEVEQRDEAVKTFEGWATLSASGPGGRGATRTVGDAKAPADLCASCWLDFASWYAEPIGPAAEPAIVQPKTVRVRAALSLDDRATMSVLISKALATQVQVAVEKLREQPTALLAEIISDDFPDVLEGREQLAIATSNEIIQRFGLAQEGELLGEVM